MTSTTPGASTDGVPPPSRAELRKVRAATILAQSTEWYDFFLYTTAAALVFPRVFFSTSFSPLAATLSSFATIAVGFVARPIGGAIFGHFGDLRGRKPALAVTLVLMALATFAIGVLPGYAAIGLMAPLVLTALRVVQGLALGGLWGGAVLLATEYAPKGQRGRFGAWAQIGLPIGLILSSGAFFAAAGLTDKASFLAYGWRVPFLAGGVVVIGALILQLRLEDTPAFRAVAKQPKRSPVLRVLREHPRRILIAVGVYLVVGGSFYVCTTGALAYGTGTLGLSRNTMLAVISLGALSMCVSIPGFSILSDRIGRSRVYVLGVVLTLLWAWPMFALFDTRQPLLAGIAVVVGMFISGIMYGPTAALFSELFPVDMRYSGASLGYQLSNVVGGGFAPLIMTSLLAATGSSYSVSVYVVVMGLITLGCLGLLRSMRRAESGVVDPDEVAPDEAEVTTA
ncbi:MFS transporter [Amycolatopsis sp. NPDC047767]|uniref:MFS transporter n=1 Tax=Amycolatopsis sp. NPDC047767 TaxID=3156765 RepID=UPI003454A693